MDFRLALIINTGTLGNVPSPGKFLLFISSGLSHASLKLFTRIPVDLEYSSDHSM